MDYLLKNPSLLNDERKNALLQLLDYANFKDSEFLKASDFRLLFYDIWALFEIGDDYKTEIVDEAVKIKEWRIFILEFFSSRNMEKMQFEYLTNSSVKKFMISLYIVKKIQRSYFVPLAKMLKLPNIKGDYAIDFPALEPDATFQEEILLRIQNNWYMNLYKFNSIYDKIVDEILAETQAVEQLFGEDVWETVSDKNLVHFMDCLEAHHFTEVLYWKTKFQTERFLKLDLTPNSTYVFCVQQDLTMRRSLNLQSALVLAVAEFSQQNEHNFVFLPFAQTVGQERIALKGKLDFNQYFEFTSNCSKNRSSLDFKSTINYAFTMLKLGLSHSNSGKIYLFCNELLFQDLADDEEWRLAVMHYKNTKNIEIAVIYIGDKSKLEPIWFADKVLFPDELTQFV